MRRRGLTVAIGTFLLVLLLIQVGRVPVPYVELGPGPTVDTLGNQDGKPVISVSGAPVSTSAGQLRLTTVEVRPGPEDNLTLLAALRGWLADDYAVVPRELIYPPDQSEQEVDDRNAQDFKDSQSSAETVALRELGFPVAVTVVELSEGLPAAAVLQVGDVITTVDGTVVTSAQKLAALIRAKPAGTVHQVTYRRGETTQTVPVEAGKADNGAARLGVVIENQQPHPFTIAIELDRIAGPSAGLMFALGVIDVLRPDDLTGGQIIAGTGTIDDEGNVGPIGGIPQKLVAAKAAKAKVFLTPVANCAEAQASAQPGLPLAKVASLQDALAALQAVREHRTPPLCTS